MPAIKYYQEFTAAGMKEIAVMVSDADLAREAAEAKVQAARLKMKDIKDKGKANITQNDLVEGFLAACDIVGV